MSRITNSQLDHRIALVNDALGIESPDCHVVGSVILSQDGAGTAIHQVATTSGAVNELSGRGTLREAYVFLAGMLAMSRLAGKVR